MKKLLVLALSVMMVLAFAAISMAEATFTGEIDPGYKTFSDDSTSKDYSMPYIFGKITMAGKLGDNVTGTMVIKSNDDPNCNASSKATSDMLITDWRFDEADVVFTESFGTIKIGYFGWNNNPKDILDSVRGDVKSNCTVSTAIKVAEGFTLGLAYAAQPTADPRVILLMLNMVLI